MRLVSKTKGLFSLLAERLLFVARSQLFKACVGRGNNMMLISGMQGAGFGKWLSQTVNYNCRNTNGSRSREDYQ